MLWVNVFMSFLTPHRYYREVLPGEIVQISKNGIKSLSIVPRPEGDPAAFCIFEYVYFARPDSIFEGLIMNDRFFLQMNVTHELNKYKQI